jgi:transposase
MPKERIPEKFITKVAQEKSVLAIGKMDSKKIIKTKTNFAKLTYGWYMFKTRLSHKVVKYGGNFVEVAENFPGRTCSHCGLG